MLKRILGSGWREEEAQEKSESLGKETALRSWKWTKGTRNFHSSEWIRRRKGNTGGGNPERAKAQFRSLIDDPIE
jgi:hypothetical protein